MAGVIDAARFDEKEVALEGPLGRAIQGYQSRLHHLQERGLLLRVLLAIDLVHHLICRTVNSVIAHNSKGTDHR